MIILFMLSSKKNQALSSNYDKAWFFVCCLNKIMKIVIKLNAMSAKKGIVINPNQLIYCPEQGTPFVHFKTDVSKSDVFCCK